MVSQSIIDCRCNYKGNLFLTTEHFHIDQKLIIRSNIHYDCLGKWHYLAVSAED